MKLTVQVLMLCCCRVVAPSPAGTYTPSPGNYGQSPSPAGYIGTPSPMGYSPMTPGAPYTPQTPGIGEYRK